MGKPLYFDHRYVTITSSTVLCDRAQSAGLLVCTADVIVDMPCVTRGPVPPWPVTAVKPHDQMCNSHVTQDTPSQSASVCNVYAKLCKASPHLGSAAFNGEMSQHSAMQ